MQLTPEQQRQVQQGRDGGDRRASVRFTTEQRKSWREAVEQELAGQGENIAHFRKIKAAAVQPGFFGDVRRAIILSRSPIGELAASIGVDAHVLSDFRAGESQLPAAALERLIETLGLRLMQEIPR